ncbi:hypothetical protein MSG28_004447, partial [Choristoneura fumiferana]
ARAEAAAGVAGELHDYCRRRAELEADYSRALDKLARAAHQKHKEQRHKPTGKLPITVGPSNRKEDYSRALDKLLVLAHQKHKREQWSLTGAYACWQAALDGTRA